MDLDQDNDVARRNLITVGNTIIDISRNKFANALDWLMDSGVRNAARRLLASESKPIETCGCVLLVAVFFAIWFSVLFQVLRVITPVHRRRRQIAERGGFEVKIRTRDPAFN
jgi:hypothetical protein